MPKYGTHYIALQADEALEKLSEGDNEGFTYARVVALRAKGLILRDLYR